jgi:hypothetical protein
MSTTQPDRETAVLSGNLLRTGGQNPTVKIVWGDEDRGADASVLSTWDNTVVISTNQAEGSFSTTITIPNQEKIYYFRSVAVNAGGTVVSRSLGVLNPSAPVGVADLRGRWSFDDSNFSALTSPTDYEGLGLWLDASDTSTVEHVSNSVSEWRDKSAQENHATSTNSLFQPTLQNNILNSLPVLSFDGSDDVMTLSGSKTFQTFFLVLNSRDGTNFSAWRWPLGGYTSASNKLYIWFGINDNSALGGSNISINGDSTSNSFSPLINHKIVTVFLNSPATRDDWKIGDGDSNWNGNFGEIIAYSGTLSNIQTQKIEGYLAHKWGITLPLNQTLAAKDSSGNNYHGVLRKTFSPAAQPDLKLWLDAADSSTITHSSNAVSQWSDKSGNANNATQSTAANKPTLTASGQNGKSVLSFDGTNDSLAATSLDISQSYSIFLVAKSDGTSSGSSGDRDYLFDGIGSDSVRSLVALNNSGTIQMWAYNSWGNSNFNTPTGYFVLSVVFNTSSSSLALNGTNVTGISVGNSSLTNGIRIGANYNANNDFLDGSIAEFFILDETFQCRHHSQGRRLSRS